MEKREEDCEFFKRGHQTWKKKKNGKILLINQKEKNRHYDGDSHIFLETKQFNQEHATKISEGEFNQIRKKHLERVTRF